MKNWVLFLSPSYKSQETFTCLFFAPLWADVACILQQPVSSSNIPYKFVWMNSMTHLLLGKFHQWSKWHSARTAWWTFSTLFVSSACGREATTQWVFNRHFTSFEMTKPLVHLRCTCGFILKSFLKHCDCFGCSFSQKEIKFHTQTHTCFIKTAISVFKKISKHTCKC